MLSKWLTFNDSEPLHNLLSDLRPNSSKVLSDFFVVNRSFISLLYIIGI